MNPSEYGALCFQAHRPGSSCLTRLHFRSGIRFVSGFLPTRPRGPCSCLQLVVAFRRPHSGLSPPSSSPCPTHLRSARYARLRSASPRRGEDGWKKNKLQKEFYTDGWEAQRLLSRSRVVGLFCLASVHCRRICCSDDWSLGVWEDRKDAAKPAACTGRRNTACAPEPASLAHRQ
jgi:hypothetical protein